jgi:two-component system heavy metal sensor histidine kinase CusS
MRIDVEVGVASGLAAGALATVVLCLLWMRAGYESLEGVRDQCLQEIRSVDRGSERPMLAIAELLEDQGHRVEIRGPSGDYRSRGWATPADELRGPLRWTLPARALFAERWRIEDRLPDDTRVSVSLSLAHYQQETGAELGQQVLESALAAWIGAALVGAFVARVAMRPIRETTNALESISESRLDARLPVRGSNDPLDRHTEALNRMLARLQWAFERLSAFSASAAHELRNPVNRILNVVDVALLRAESERVPIEALQHVQETAQQLKRVVESLLLLARGEEGRLTLERKPENLRELLAKIVEFYEPLASERDVEIALSGEPVSAEVDRPLIEHVIANLLDNALRYAPPGSAVRAGVRARGERVEVVIEDEGPGIPAEQRRRVFDRFVRLDATRASPGMGLGLPIARMLAQLHDGDVVLEAGARGGTRATLRLPLRPRRESSAGSPVSSRA